MSDSAARVVTFPGTAAGASVQRWMTLDLYVAVVGASDGFDEWYDRKGFADAWSALCVKVQEVFRDCPGH